MLLWVMENTSSQLVKLELRIDAISCLMDDDNKHSFGGLLDYASTEEDIRRLLGIYTQLFTERRATQPNATWEIKKEGIFNSELIITKDSGRRSVIKFWNLNGHNCAFFEGSLIKSGRHIMYLSSYSDQEARGVIIDR